MSFSIISSNFTKFGNSFRNVYRDKIHPQLKTSIRFQSNRSMDPIEEKISSNIRISMNKNLLVRPFLFTVGVSDCKTNVKKIMKFNKIMMKFRFQLVHLLEQPFGNMNLFEEKLKK